MDKEISELELKKMIGKMLIVGFDTLDILQDDVLYESIKKYELGGVILFDRFYYDRDRAKNIQSPKQLKNLTKNLQKISQNKLLIAIDQEGGKVARLKESTGFRNSLSAQKVSQLDELSAKGEYEKLSVELEELGINCNFAPLVDLALNEENEVIYKLERSYGSDVDDVVGYGDIFMDALHKHNILSVLKHFPGHGSSFGDSHKGFVDVSDTWNKVELEPYKRLLPKTKMIMSAHVFNKNIDDKYPATLSYKTNTQLLRETLGFGGVVVSDDMQMMAIRDNYSKKEAIKLSINAGVDMLIFGNQLAQNSVKEIINIIYKLVQDDEIKLFRIQEANERITKLLGEI